MYNCRHLTAVLLFQSACWSWFILPAAVSRISHLTVTLLTCVASAGLDHGCLLCLTMSSYCGLYTAYNIDTFDQITLNTFEPSQLFCGRVDFGFLFGVAYYSCRVPKPVLWVISIRFWKVLFVFTICNKFWISSVVSEFLHTLFCLVFIPEWFENETVYHIISKAFYYKKHCAHAK